MAQTKANVSKLNKWYHEGYQQIVFWDIIGLIIIIMAVSFKINTLFAFLIIPWLFTSLISIIAYLRGLRK